MRRVEIYAGRKGVLSRKQWYARVVGGLFDEPLFRSTEGYNNRGELEALCKSVFPTLPVEFVDPPSAVKP
jgi:hypothetical protein